MGCDAMTTKPSRRVLAALVGAAVGLVTVLVAAPPAEAAVSASVLFKGTGSLYTANPYVSQGVLGGKTATYALKIVNTGTALQQYKLVLAAVPPGLQPRLLVGSAPAPVPYYTTPIAPGGSLVLTVKVDVPSGTAAEQDDFLINLLDPATSALVAQGGLGVNVTYQSNSNWRNALYVKTGQQPYAGGATYTNETATALKVGSTATFVLRVHNDDGGTGYASMKAVFTAATTHFKVTVKDGTQDVTAAFVAGTYSTQVIAPGASKDFKVTVKLLDRYVGGAVFFFVATGPSGQVVQGAHVVAAV